MSVHRAGWAANNRRRGLSAYRALLGILAVTVVACAPQPDAELRLGWSPVEALNANLPDGIRVYAAADPSVPIKAWYVSVRGGASAPLTRVVVAQGATGLESVSKIAERTGARVAINGGYFRTDRERPLHVGLLVADGVLIQPPLRSLRRDGQRYFVARAALGVMADGGFDVAWVSTADGELRQWSTPPENAPGAPGAEPDLAGLLAWNPRHAVAGGPVLVSEGQVRITHDEEVFFDALAGAQPRTAAGVTAAGDLIALVIDGRQRESRGVDLHELAVLMRDLGSYKALNLDGGGSTTLVVDGTLINLPLGSNSEREIMSALTVSEMPTSIPGERR